MLPWLRSKLVLAAGTALGCLLIGVIVNQALASRTVGGPITNGGWAIGSGCGSAALVFEPHRMLAIAHGRVKSLGGDRTDAIDILGDAAHPQIRMWIGKEKRIALVFYAEIDGDALRFTRYEYETLGKRSGPPAQDDFFQPIFAHYQDGQPYHRCARPTV